MGLFNNFPYTNFHELNLDWLVKKVKEISSQIPEGLIGISKGGTGADNAASARHNLEIYGNNIPLTALDNQTVEAAISGLTLSFIEFANDIQFRIFKSVTKAGQTQGTATVLGCWSGMTVSDMLVVPASDFAPSQVPEVSGTVIIVKQTATTGFVRFNGDHSYIMKFSGGVPSGPWKQIYSSDDIIPIANGGTGASNAADAITNLGIDFSGEVLSVAGVGADSTGNVPLTPADINAMPVYGIQSYDGQNVNAGTNAQIMRIPANWTDSRITENTIVLSIEFSSPDKIESSVAWESHAGYIEFIGTCTAATTANVILGTKGN